MPEPLGPALDSLRHLLTGDALVRAVASGHRRADHPAWTRAELRVVRLRGQDAVQQVLTAPHGPPETTHLAPGELRTAVETLLAEPFSSWHVRTRDRVVQLRVTKRGEAQVHTEDAAAPAPAEHDHRANHLIDPGDPLFTVLGADAAKRRQVDAFLRQLEPVVRRLAGPGEPLRVLDLGCGNAYLTMAAHRWLAASGVAACTTGIDVRPAMAARNAALAAEIGLVGIDFVPGQIAGPAGGAVPDEPDLVLALHACDTATDDALALAVRTRARAVLAAPCCHHDLQRQLAAARSTVPHPYAALMRHAILGERFADVLTDALRADLLRLLGYRTEVVEFVESRHTPRNAMIRAVRTGAPPTARRVQEYTDLVSAWACVPALAARLEPELAAALG